MQLTVTNVFNVPIVVTALTTGVTSTSPTCSAFNVRVSEFNGYEPVPPGDTRQRTVWVSMAQAAPNTCEGAVFQFHFHGVARQK